LLVLPATLNMADWRDEGSAFTCSFRGSWRQAGSRTVSVLKGSFYRCSFKAEPASIVQTPRSQYPNAKGHCFLLGYMQLVGCKLHSGLKFRVKNLVYDPQEFRLQEPDSDSDLYFFLFLNGLYVSSPTRSLNGLSFCCFSLASTSHLRQALFTIPKSQTRGESIPHRHWIATRYITLKTYPFGAHLPT